MNNRHSLHFLWLVAVALLISACGFHLKGTQRAQSDIDNLYLVINNLDEETSMAIIELMNNNHIELVNNGESPYEVRVFNTIRERNLTAVGGQLGNVEEIDITDGFNVNIYLDGEEIGQTTITSRTTIRYDSDQYLGSREEEERAHRQLARDNADKLLRYIDARLNN